MNPKLSHGTATLAMAAAALLISTTGATVRYLDAAQGLQITFWRSASAALALLLFSLAAYGPRRFITMLRDGGAPLLLSAFCWSVMFTAFMVALTLTTVANVLIVLAIDPLLTTAVARIALRTPIHPRTWFAGGACCVGVILMVGLNLDSTTLVGCLVALLVPLAAACNWTLSQHINTTGKDINLIPAVLLGALISAAFCYSLSNPLQISTRDIAILASLGSLQCAIPCAIAVVCARTLTAPELALLALLEMVCGIAWVWLFGQEKANVQMVIGAAIVLLSVLAHQLHAMRARPAPKS